MAVLVTIRHPGSEPFDLAIDGSTYADPDEANIETDLGTSGLFALPGLADCHAHLGMNNLGEAAGLSDAAIRSNIVANAWAQVEHGVLLVNDKGAASDVTLEILDAPPERRPQLQMAGRMIATSGGYYPDYAVEVDESDLAGAVAAAAGPGGWVKIVADWPRRGRGPEANFSAEALATAVEVAHRAGCRVAAHTMAPAGIEPVVAGGVDSVEHGLFMTPEHLEQLRSRDGCWVPTVLGAEAIIAFLGADSSGGRLLSEGLANVRQLLPLAEALGVTVLAGTDLAVPHGQVAREALRLADFGLSPSASVNAVSSAAYDYLDVDRSFRPGSTADAVFFSDDPTEHLAALAEPRLIIRRGSIVMDRR